MSTIDSKHSSMLELWREFIGSQSQTQIHKAIETIHHWIDNYPDQRLQYPDSRYQNRDTISWWLHLITCDIVAVRAHMSQENYQTYLMTILQWMKGEAETPRIHYLLNGQTDLEDASAVLDPIGTDPETATTETGPETTTNP